MTKRTDTPGKSMSHLIADHLEEHDKTCTVRVTHSKTEEYGHVEQAWCRTHDEQLGVVRH